MVHPEAERKWSGNGGNAFPELPPLGHRGPSTMLPNGLLNCAYVAYESPRWPNRGRCGEPSSCPYKADVGGSSPSTPTTCVQVSSDLATHTPAVAWRVAGEMERNGRERWRRACTRDARSNRCCGAVGVPPPCRPVVGCRSAGPVARHLSPQSTRLATVDGALDRALPLASTYRSWTLTKTMRGTRSGTGPGARSCCASPSGPARWASSRPSCR